MNRPSLFSMALLATISLGPVSGQDYNGPAITPDGSRVYYHELGVGIWSMALDGSDKVNHTSGSGDRWVTVSPDGSQIGFVSPSRGGGWTAYRADLDVSAPQPIAKVDESRFHVGFVWLPDGRLVTAEMKPRTEGAPQEEFLFLHDRDGSVAQIGSGKWPVVSPAGDEVAYFARVENADGSVGSDLFAWEVDGDVRRVTRSDHYEGFAAYSPTGGAYFFVTGSESDDGPIHWLTMAPRSDASSVTNLGLAVRSDSRPAASPDGAFLFFAMPSPTTGRLSIYRLEFATGDLINLTP